MNVLYKSVLTTLPVLQQRQDSATDQLQDLKYMANRLGMYDAADAIQKLFNVDKFATLKFGCHCDIESMEEGFEPDACVIDYGDYDDCIYAKVGMRKEQCEYWRIIK